MIMRPFTLFAGLLFVLSGAFMFIVKHRSQLLDAQLSATNQATTQDEQSIRVLQAQWALEADPSRLASLAAQFTGLQPMKPGQLVTLSSLGSALPAPGAAAPQENPEDPVPALPQLAAAMPAPAAAAVQTASAAPAQAAATQAPPAVKMAAAVPSAAQVAEAVAAASTRPSANTPEAPRHRAAERLASAARPVHHPAPFHHAGGSALYLAEASAPAPVAHGAPLGAQVMAVRAVAAPRPMPAPPALDDGGSLLGMAQGGSQ